MKVTYDVPLPQPQPQKLIAAHFFYFFLILLSRFWAFRNKGGPRPITNNVAFFFLVFFPPSVVLLDLFYEWEFKEGEFKNATKNHTAFPQPSKNSVTYLRHFPFPFHGAPCPLFFRHSPLAARHSPLATRHSPLAITRPSVQTVIRD
jgi:hypothetical protein